MPSAIEVEQKDGRRAHGDETRSRCGGRASDHRRTLRRVDGLRPLGLGQPLRRLLPEQLPVPRVREGRRHRPRRAGGDVPGDRAGRAGHEPDGLPEGRLVEPPAVRRRTHPASDAARGRARRRHVAADLVGRSADGHRRSDARHDAGRGAGEHRPHRHAGSGRHAEHRAGGRGVQQAGLHDDRRAGRDQRLEPRHLHHLRTLRPVRQQRRLVPFGRHPDLGEQSGVQRHPARPLHQRSALPRRARRDRRPGLQPFGDPRRHLRAGAHRQRRRSGALDVPGDPRRAPDGPGVRPRADGPAAAGAHGHRPLPAAAGRRGGRPRRHLLPVRQARAADRRGAAPARPRRDRAGAARYVHRTARRREER